MEEWYSSHNQWRLVSETVNDYSFTTGTFDVHNVTLNGPVVRGRVCLNVTYVEGHELPAECYIVFRCSTIGHDMYHATIQGPSMCIPNVPAHTSYTIIATDGDAVDEIISTAPVTILGVAVPVQLVLPLVLLSLIVFFVTLVTFMSLTVCSRIARLKLQHVHLMLQLT